MSTAPKTTYWHVIGENRLFIVRGKAAHESFEELRRKTPDKKFKFMRASWVKLIRASQPFADEIVLDF